MDFVNLRLVFNKEVNPVDQASLERMYVLLAVETEVMLAMLTPARVVILLNVGYCSTGWKRAPAHVIHLLYSILETEGVILFPHLFTQS